MIARGIHFIRRRLGTRWGIDPRPILIYQIGKVGSSTIRTSLERLGRYDVYQVHRLNPENIARVRRAHDERGWPHPRTDRHGLALYERLVQPRVPARIITLVREPIGRSFSYYFQNLDKICGRRHAHRAIPVERLIRDFPVTFPYSDNHLTWFDDEFKVVTGIDLYQPDLDLKKGYDILDSDVYQVLILQTHAPDAVKAAALSRLLDLDDVPIIRTNVTSRKSAAEAYRRFREQIRLVPAYLDHMLNARYSRTFFDWDDLQRWRQVYGGRGSIIPEALQALQLEMDREREAISAP